MRSLRRTLLFVPANNPRMVEKAVSLESDAVILDCEDSVPPGHKLRARTVLAEGLGNFDWSAKEVGVRVNEIGTEFFPEDVKQAVSSGVDFIAVPKIEEASEVRTVEDLISRFAGENTISAPKILVTIENPKGLGAVEDILKASRLVTAVEFGAEDYALNLGIYKSRRNELATLYARSRVVAAAHAISVDPLDQAFTDLEDMDGLRRSADDARDLGFTGKAVIHPSQVRVVNEAFSPSEADIDWANRLLQAWDSATKEGKGAFRLDGMMVDMVHLKMAQTLLKKAERLGKPS